MQCTIIRSETHQYPYTFIYISDSVLYHISKNQHCNFNTFQDIICFKSLQDHNIHYKQNCKMHQSVNVPSQVINTFVCFIKINSFRTDAS